MAPTKLEPSETAFLTLDLQHGILGMANVAPSVTDAAARAAAHSRTAGYLVLHIGLGFAPGHPGLPPLSQIPADSPFHAVVANNKLLVGSPEAGVHPSVYKEGEAVLYKTRYGAFGSNQLDLVLRARGIRNLVMCGVVTSGVVLSTVRYAYDLDYRMVVLQDACWDREEEVHRLLCEKVLPKQAQVVKVDDFVKG